MELFTGKTVVINGLEIRQQSRATGAHNVKHLPIHLSNPVFLKCNKYFLNQLKKNRMTIYIRLPIASNPHQEFPVGRLQVVWLEDS